MNEPKLSEEGERLIRDYQEAVDSFGYVFSRNHKFEPAFDKLCKSLAALRARMAFLESEVARLSAAPQWEANHQRAKLEQLGLADEFPFDCDSIEHVGEALLVARARVAELESANGWRPIETARMGDHVITADLDECRVWITIIGNPYMQQGQLWMPLPVLPPRAQADNSAEG